MPNRSKILPENTPDADNWSKYHIIKPINNSSRRSKSKVL